jgi:N-acetylmuramoyl-L-alanine amidase
VVNLRPEDKYIGLPDRTAKANAVAADLLLSIHLNALPKTKQDSSALSNGFEIVLGKNNSRYAESQNLASAVASQLRSLELPTKLIDKGLQVLRTAEMPAILIECGNIDNAKDVERIRNNEQLDKLCATILSGLVLYQNSRNK